MDLTKPTPISIARNDNALPEPVLVCEQRASRSDATPDTWNGICMASARMAFWQHLHNFSRTWFSREKQLRHHQVLHFDAFISIKIPSDTEKSASQKGDTQIIPSNKDLWNHFGIPYLLLPPSPSLLPPGCERICWRLKASELEQLGHQNHGSSRNGIRDRVVVTCICIYIYMPYMLEDFKMF